MNNSINIENKRFIMIYGIQMYNIFYLFYVKFINYFIKIFFFL